MGLFAKAAESGIGFIWSESIEEVGIEVGEVLKIKFADIYVLN